MNGNAEFGMRNAESSAGGAFFAVNEIPHSAFRIPTSAFV
jgi:hypothetical protein